MKAHVNFLSIACLLPLLLLSACLPVKDSDFEPTRAETVPTVSTKIVSTPANGALLYGKETLTYWQTRYSDSTRKIYEIGFLPYLSPVEKEVLADVQIQFPLTGESIYENDPTAFYSLSEESVVVMPVLSLKFLDDLSTAYAWLWHNGYELETVTDYVSMLKYQPETFRAGHFPPPLTALHIPEDALSNPEVDALALGFFNEARALILAHELGHILYGHDGGSAISTNESQKQEHEADAFALDLMIRTATQPMGAYLYFFTRAHWDSNLGDFNNDPQAWQAYLDEATHPLTAYRMALMAEKLSQSAELMAIGKPNPVAETETTLFIAEGMKDIAEMLEDPEISLSIRLKGQATDVAFLAPRYSGQRPCDSVDILTRSDTIAFDGLHVVDYIRYLPDAGSETLPMCLLLNRNGDSVNGYFMFDLGEGSIVGQVVGEILVFQWQWGSFSGKGFLESKDNGNTIVGEWGYEQATEGGGQWIGKRS